MKQRLRKLLVSCCCLAAFGSISTAEVPNWPAWRGDGQVGSAKGDKYPDKIDDSTISWKIALPGKGCSTPIVWDEQIIVTSPAAGKNMVIAYNMAGEERWKTTFGSERKGKHRNGSGSNPSPITDGKLIYVLFKSGHLAALDLKGGKKWQINLQEEYGGVKLYWDFGTSPVLTKDNVVVAIMHGGKSYVAAFEKLSGKLAWKEDRTYDTPVENDHSYTTPIVIDDGKGGQSIVVWGAERLTGHSAKNGKILWTSEGFNPTNQKNWVAVASHVHAGDVAIVPYGRGTRIAGIKLDPNASGDVTKSHRLWDRGDTGSFVPTPAVYEGKLFVVKDRGQVICINPNTGKTIWEDKLPRAGTSYYSSPTIAGGKLFAAREDGTVFVAQIKSDGIKLLSTNELGEQVIASPVPLGDRVLLRSAKHLYCVAARK